jgi:ABC-type lipoprotein release transport system permease subunit
MRPFDYAAASLRYYWRTNLAAAAGVAVAVATLGGSLLVGVSVRTSLRDLALARLGQVHAVVIADALFTEALAERIGGVPVLALDGVVVHEESGRRATGVQVFGVDDRFWRLQQVAGVSGPANRTAFLSPALAAEFGAKADDALQVRIQKPSAIPAGVLQGRRDEPGRAVRVSVGRVLTRAESGEFLPAPRQGDARTIFVPLSRLQRDADFPGLANMVLAGAAAGADTTRLRARVREAVSLEDLGLRVRPLPGGTGAGGSGSGPIAVESTAGYLSDIAAEGAARAIGEAGGSATPVLTYLATAIRANGRETPYSLVSALPRTTVTSEPPRAEGDAVPPIWLTAWTAGDLGTRPGDAVTLEYFLWSDDGGLSTATATFAVAGVLPMEGLALDRDLTPEYPGVSTSEEMADWDPPFPVDLTRVRKKDEDFWREHRTAPKAFITIEDGQRLWTSRYGKVTSLRAAGLPEKTLRTALAARLPASTAGFQLRSVRADAVAAAAGTTDFGEYFAYFSAFVVAASLLLTALFFRLGVEQRAAEAGTLAAFGFTPGLVRRLFLLEGVLITVAGALAGTAGAVGFTALMMAALRTVWIGAVGTTELRLTVTAWPLLAGALGGVAASLACVLWTLRGFRRTSVHGLMAGTWLNPDGSGRQVRGLRVAAMLAAAAAAVLVAAGALDRVPAVAAFFGSGSLLLTAGLCGSALLLRRLGVRFLAPGPRPLVRLGLRNLSARPARSLLSVALIAGASFLIVAVGAFRLGGRTTSDPHGGTGGYLLVAESVQPLMHDPATAAGRDALNLPPDAATLDIARFRLRPGDDASCANLYRPSSPRLLGAPEAFVAQNRFAFAGSLAATVEERENPWRLLERPAGARVVPVIGDATSLAYAFHVRLGDDIVIDAPDGRPLTLRVVGALRDSVLQSELIMSDAQFTRWFPRHEGYRVFLVGEGAGQAGARPARDPDAIATLLEGQLGDFGFDAQSAEGRLAAYHRVENTYLNTFQALGGFGLILGTFGLGTVLLRNVLERRREMALLRATGFRTAHLVRAVVAESVCLLTAGLVLGLACAMVAIGPAYAGRGEGLPIAATLGLLAAVAASGILSTLIATRAVASSDLLPALKHE